MGCPWEFLAGLVKAKFPQSGYVVHTIVCRKNANLFSSNLLNKSATLRKCFGIEILNSYGLSCFAVKCLGLTAFPSQKPQTLENETQKCCALNQCFWSSSVPKVEAVARLRIRLGMSGFKV